MDSKIFSRICVSILLCAAGLPAWAAAFEVDGIKYETNDDGGVTVTGSSLKSGSIAFPSRVTTDGQSYSVTAIAPNAFKKSKLMIDGRMPVSLKEIGENAFYQVTTITEIDLPAGMRKVGNGAFYDCTGVKSLTLRAPDCEYVASSGRGSYVPFYGIGSEDGLTVTLADEVEVFDPAVLWTYTTADKITELNISRNSKLVTIGDLYAPRITELLIPAGVTTFAEGALSGLENLRRLEYRARNASFERDDRFYGLNNLCAQSKELELVIGREVESIPDNLFRNYSGLLFKKAGSSWPVVTKLTIEDGSRLVKIGYGAFEGNYMLTDIPLPPTVKEIGGRAFACCYSLKTAELPSQLEALGQNAYGDCWGVETLVYDIADLQACRVITNVSPNYDTGYSRQMYEDLGFVVPEKVKVKFGSNVVRVPTSFAYYGMNVELDFSHATSLKTIGKEAFSSIENFIGDIILPEGLEHVEGDAFWGTDLKEITLYLPSTLSEFAVNWDMDIKHLIFNMKEGAVIGGGYRNTDNNKDVSLTIGKDVERLNGGCFGGINHISRLQIDPEIRLRYIGQRVFAGSPEGEFFLPATLDSIADEAFLNSHLRGEFVLPENILKIGTGAFKGCTEITCKSMVVPEAIGSIPVSLFNGCAGFEGTLTFPAHITFVGENSFKDTSFERLVIEDSAEPLKFDDSFDPHGSWIIKAPAKEPVAMGPNISEGQFAYTQISDLYLGRDADYLKGVYADLAVTPTYCSPFSKSDKLVNVETGSMVTTIGAYQFAYCPRLATVKLGAAITKIEKGAFAGCEKLQTITIDASTPPEVEEWAFGEMDCSKVTLNVPAGSKAAYMSCEAWQGFDIVEGGEGGIDNVAIDSEETEAECYDISGRRLMHPAHGINIVVGKDGKVQKKLLQ